MARCIRRCSGSRSARFVSAEWGTSENNRKARFYTLTKKGRAELTREHSEWKKVAAAIMRVLETKQA